MGRAPSPAQRAVQITFVLKGHLKNAQVAYIRVAALLARVRDEKLDRAPGHPTMDDYPAARQQGRRDTPPLRAVLRALRAARRRLAGIPGLSVKPLEALDALIAEIEAAVTSTHRIARLAGLPRLRAARA